MRASLNCLDEAVSASTIRSMRERMDLLEEENRQLRAAAKVRGRRDGAERMRELEMSIARLSAEVAEKTAEAQRLAEQYLEASRRGPDVLLTLLRRGWGLSERRAAFLVCLYRHEGFVSAETLRAAIGSATDPMSDEGLKVLTYHTRRQIAHRGVDVVSRYRAGYALTGAGRAVLRNAIATFEQRGAA